MNVSKVSTAVVDGGSDVMQQESDAIATTRQVGSQEGRCGRLGAPQVVSKQDRCGSSASCQTSENSRMADSVAAPVIKHVNRKSRRSGRTSKADLERHKPKVEELFAGSVYDIWEEYLCRM